MPYRKDLIPEYSLVERGKNSYYITGIKDLDGKRMILYGKSREELYKKSRAAQKSIAAMAERWKNPTVADYCDRWMKAELPKLRYNTRESYKANIEKYILPALGEMRLRDVTPDDIKVAMVPVSQRTSDQYQKVHMLVKRIFESAVDNDYIESSPCRKITARGGKPKTEREPLTDEQAQQLIRLVRGTPLYLFVMLGLYAGMRRGEILGLQWDCVYLDAPAPYLTVQRMACCNERGKPTVSTQLKSPAAYRDIPLPKPLEECIREAKANAQSKFVVVSREGKPIEISAFSPQWAYVHKHTVEPGVEPNTQKMAEGEVWIDFHVVPHQLRHTYITNLVNAGADPKTVQYLAGHENSKTTLDIYAKAKYNQPEDLRPVVNEAFGYD